MAPDKETPIELTNAEGYTFGIWHEVGRNVFGLAYEGHRTHMTYGTDYLSPREMVDTTKEIGAFHFDVGNGVTCTAAEFERCMQHVGLVP